VERYWPAAILIVLALGGIMVTKHAVRSWTALGAVLGVAVLVTVPAEPVRPLWFSVAAASIACEVVALVLSIRQTARRRHG
jgi:hypothetical protein